jgi:hypothetical protein
MTLQHLLDGLLDFATNEQGSKSVMKALKEGGKETLDRVVERMCEPAKGCVSFPLSSQSAAFAQCSCCVSRSRRAMIVDLALSMSGSQLIASVLPTVFWLPTSMFRPRSDR